MTNLQCVTLSLAFLLLQYDYSWSENVNATDNVVNYSSSPLKIKKREVERLIEKSFGFLRAPFHRIKPGTLWCGDGHITPNYDSLGFFARTDACCREHDHCQFNIPAGESFRNLTNDGDFTKSACYCDHTFYNCLKNVNTLISWMIGIGYFNKLSPECFEFNYPILSCARYEGRKCIEYVRDTSQQPVLQWIDNLIF